MNKSSSKTTIILIVALVLVCGGSFLGVKLLNSSAKAAPTTTATTFGTFAATTTSTTAPMSTTASASAPSVGAVTTKTEDETNGLPGVETMSVATTAVADDAEIETTAATTKADVTTTEETTGSQFTTFAVSGETSTTKATTKAAVTTEVDPNEVEIKNEEEAQELINQASQFSEGFLGYLYDARGNFFYTTSDPWQRSFGFNQLYDMGAPFLVFYYDTMRIKLNYDHKDWMVQFWKGQYGWVFIGGEIGVYNKPEDRSVEHYDCASDEDALAMSMTFYRDGKEKATRDYAKYWWCTAFVPGKLDSFQDRSELEIRARITMKDYAMLLSFCNALKESGYKINQNYTVSGLDVYMVY